MKLILIISTLSAGGAERVLSLLASHWAARGEDVTLVTIDGIANDAYPIDPRVRRVPLGLERDSAGLYNALANNWRRIVALRAAVRAAEAPVVLSFGEYTNVLTICATRFMRLRCVLSERTDPAQHDVGWIWNALRRLTYPRADALVVQTAALRPWANRLIGRKRVHVIPNPVRDLRHVTDAGRASDAPILVAAGRLVPPKGLDILLQAFARVAPRAPEWRLIVLGEGPERGRLTTLARQLGIANRVSLDGWVAEPAAVFARAGIFVLSSRYEGFPNALLEAMACGLPVVATACTGPAAIISHEKDGLLVEVGSASALAAAILRLIEDEPLRRRLGGAAADVSRRFGIDAIVRTWDSVLGASIPPSAAALGDTAASRP